MTLVAEIYKISKGFPKDEVYGLTSQMRRCAISIPNNMADCNRFGEFTNFLSRFSLIASLYI